MAKYFTDENASLPEGATKKKLPGKTRYFEEIDETPVPAEPTPQPDPLAEAGAFGLDVLHNFNNALTLGLWPKFLEITGLDTQAEEKLAESNPWAKIIGDTGGYILPTSAVANTAARIVPALAKHTLPAIVGREAIAGGAVSAGEDLVQGKVDLADTALDAALAGGGAGFFGGAIHGINRLVNPYARIRAAGADLLPADRDAAAGFSQFAADQGIPLTNAEAVSAVAPDRAQRVQSIFEGAAKAPDASNVLAAFNARRKPMLVDVGHRMALDIRGGADPLSGLEASNIASDAIGNVKGGFSLAARPFYELAEPKKIPPTWVPKRRYVPEAARYVKENTPLMQAMEDNTGVRPDPNSILFLDAVRNELESMASSAFSRNRAKEGGFILDDLDALTAMMDRFAPDYKKGREISEQGKRALAELYASPLGIISKSTKPSTQAGSLFGITNASEKEAVDLALAHVGDELPLGLLANHIESAVNKKPIGWGKSALPNELSQQVADDILTAAGKDSIIPTLRAAKAVDPRDISPTPNEHTGPVGELWSVLRDWGKKGVTTGMLDPKTIRMLGVQGPLEAALIRGSTAATQASIGGKKRGRRRRKRG